MLSSYQFFFRTKSIVFILRTATPVLLLLPVLMTSMKTNEADRSPVSRQGTESVSSSLPPTKTAVMVQPQLRIKIYFPIDKYWCIFFVWWKIKSIALITNNIVLINLLVWISINLVCYDKYF